VSVPPGLEWWREEPDGSIWLQHLPDIVGECTHLWSLELGEPFHLAHVSYVAPVELSDGTSAVLKINFPEEESEHEADALAHWDGEGAVRLLGRYDERRALLVERCKPGRRLWETRDGDDVTRIVAGVLRRLWKSPRDGHRFRLLADAAAEWAEELPRGWEDLGRPYEESLLGEAVAFLREAGPAQGEQVVLHQDLHGGNVLQAQREPWLAIDPKPLVGEREFETASFLRDRRWELRNTPLAGMRVRRRLDLLASELDLDRDRMRGWGLAHALAWGMSGKPEQDRDMAACARWLAAA
jgi:streptomycin 6-kinase